MEDLARPGPLAAVLDDAAAGRFPPADGGVTSVRAFLAAGFKPAGAEAHLIQAGPGE
jgi:hypothetical protein